MTNTQEPETRPPTYQTTVAFIANAEGDPPAGVRVVEPPAGTRQALRGNLYAIVELSGDNPEREDLAERLLSTMQRTYYTEKGSQSQVLARAVRQARQKITE